MTGMNLNIAKFLTRALISNFQPDDFFNVLLFNQETSYLFPDIHSLKQATSFYKTAFINAVNELENTKLECNVSQALKMGFETIANTSESSNCTKVIMLISDGIDSNPNIQRDLERYNRDKNVVIFSYIIGNKDDVVMKDIACSNNGQSFQVAAMGRFFSNLIFHIEQKRGFLRKKEKYLKCYKFAIAVSSSSENYNQKLFLSFSFFKAMS